MSGYFRPNFNFCLFHFHQDAISHADPITQILYNRTMVQLGLCGFRHAEIREAHNALLDIQLQGRSKELIAQGLLPQVNIFNYLGKGSLCEIVLGYHIYQKEI